MSDTTPPTEVGLSEELGVDLCRWDGGAEPCSECPRRITALHTCRLLQSVNEGALDGSLELPRD